MPRSQLADELALENQDICVNRLTIDIIDGDEMRDRFNRAYAARKKAGHTIPIGRGVWVSLYLSEAQDPVNCVGAGAGLTFPPIATVPLTPELIAAIEETRGTDEAETSTVEESEGAPLSIAEAKRRLAKTLGVADEFAMLECPNASTAGTRIPRYPGPPTPTG